MTDHPNVSAFLRVIREGETSQDPIAYHTIVGGGTIKNFDRHPAESVYIPSLRVHSTAAGAYQFLSRTWNECEKALDLPDFSPESQDKAAVFLIKRRGALQDVIDGKIEQAIAKCAKEWASLPGSPYGQPTLTMERALATYVKYGGTWHTEATQATPTTKETPMTPFLIPAVIELAKMIPKLGGMFGGSEVAQRNVKAAEVVIEAVTGAVGAANAQEAVEKIQADPVAREQAVKAVEGVWYQISETGSGGIDGARKADAAMVASNEPVWRSPSFVMGCLLLPLVYLIVGNVTGLYGVEWAPEARAGIAGSLAGGIVMGLIGYYFGQTTSRNRTPAP
jgi:muramidase (phage lysozyme)